MTKKTFLITGCSSGIGHSLAKQLGEKGHRVFAGVRTLQNSQGLASNNVIPIVLDVNNKLHVEKVVDTIEGQVGKLDGLINNAGYGEMGPLLEISADKIERQFMTNVFSPLYLVQAMSPLLRKSDCAIIVNIGSAAGIFTTPFSGVYCASKAAFHTLSEVMRMELSPLDIHVMTVYPGAVASSFGDNASKQLVGVLRVDSLYRNIGDAIEKRATVSKRSPTTPDSFAEELITKINMLAPPTEISIGHGSSMMRFTKAVLPLRLREWLLRKNYKLDQLA